MNALKKPSPITLRNIVITLVVIIVMAVIVYGLKKSVNSTEAPIVLQGQMEMQSTAIAAKVPGRIAKIMVTEGDSVGVGQQLIEMDSPEITAKMNQALAGREMAQSQLDKAQNGARPQEIGQAKAAWQANQAAADLAKSTYERVNRLYEEGLMARQKRDEAYTQYTANQDKANAARLQYEMALEGAREEDKAAARAQVAQVDAKIAEAQVAQDEANLKSPIAGIVDDVIVNPGEVVGQGVPIMTLVDVNDQWVVLNVTEDNLSHFRIGSEFSASIPALSTADHPYQMQFKVFNTAAMPDFAVWRATNTEDNFDVRTFEVKARPLQPDPKVRSGMSVLVSLDTQTDAQANTQTSNTPATDKPQ
ncbi:HlyD family secretion protein [Psychrobacter lutiphocae]|uniref:HlyD family secretion protein n=1 Tax=Psychrobacter lutiphocae TaxID=540500 RepID=UPI00037DEC83|nr:efflux RND transporter periplasmic adaptor subunit [Psychrobacter lutiphocae]